jgi:hypothetical protein
VLLIFRLSPSHPKTRNVARCTDRGASQASGSARMKWWWLATPTARPARAAKTNLAAVLSLRHNTPRLDQRRLTSRWRGEAIYLPVFSLIMAIRRSVTGSRLAGASSVMGFR